ncbi:unnamed protein product [Colias eurytheme]|nr:unnamed protein product [Colias eurytheme]
MWSRILLAAITLIVLCSPALSALIRGELYQYPEVVQEYDVIIKNIDFDDSPVYTNDCPPGSQLDISGMCREVW